MLALKTLLLVIFATIIGSFGPILLKHATLRLDRNALSSIKQFLRATIGNWYLVLGLGFYGVSFIIYLFALKGADLSVVYPLVALAYVWVSFLSVWFLGERMTLMKWLGIGLLLVGATLVGLGS